MRAGPPLEHGSHLPETIMLTGSRSSTCELFKHLSDVDQILITLAAFGILAH